MLVAPTAASVDPSALSASDGTWRRQRRILLACAAAAILYTLFFCARDAESGLRVDIVEASTRAAAEWLAWALLAPIAWSAAERWPLREPFWSATLGRHAVLAAVLAVTQALMFWLLMQLRAELGIAPVRLVNFFNGGEPRFLATRFDGNLVIYAFIVAIATGERRARETEAANRERIEAERGLLAARLEALRQQLRPHFVLNALNTFLSALAVRPAEAKRILSALRRLLSRPDPTAPLVTLGEEIELVRLYAAIEEARFRDRLTVEWAIDPRVAAVPIPPFALQTLFENAIRHATPTQDGRVRIRVSAQPNDHDVVVRVANDGPIGGGEASGTGIGLANLSARLGLLFGNSAHVDLYETGGRTVASIALPEMTS